MATTEIKEAIVCYFDILGYRQLVRNNVDIKLTADRLDNAVRRAIDAFGGREILKRSRDSEWKLKTFSDCLCFAKPLSDSGLAISLQATSEFIQEMIYSGFPVKGGIALGSYYESEFLMFSNAQVNAYDIESNRAKFPRVVISEEFVERLEHISDADLRMFTKEFIIVDSDGESFVNYLIFYEEDSWQSGHKFFLHQKRNIEAILSDSEITEEVKDKYLWLSMFHNWTLRHSARILKSSGILTEDDVWSFSSLLVENGDKVGEYFCLLKKDKFFLEQLEEDSIQNDNYRDRILRSEKVDWIRESPFDITVSEEEEEAREGDIHD